MVTVFQRRAWLMACFIRFNDDEWKTGSYRFITMSLMEIIGVSNHGQLDCLFNSLFGDNHGNTSEFLHILGNFYYINFRSIELVISLGLYTIEERRDYFLAMLMLKSIHGIAPAYLCNQIVMNFDINDYDTRGTYGINVYLPTVKKDIYKNSYLYKGGQVWNRLPDVVKDSPNLETFKYHYKLQKSVTDACMLCSFIHVSILQCKGKLLNIITPRIDSWCTYVL